MRPADIARLVVLAAIWGASFIFMRLAAPALGPVLMADLRLLIAGLALAAWLLATGYDMQWRRYWKQYAVLGVVNSGVPFVMYAFAALHLPASLSAVLNATAPLFGALFGALWLGERLGLLRIAGLAAGIAGVALVSQPGGLQPAPFFGWAIAACLLACACYGVTGVLIRKLAPQAKPTGIAVGSQLAAGVALLPAVPFALPGTPPGAVAILSVLVLALLCSALAYVLYFRLIADIGATRALTVTYLIPVFGILWGALFLGESLPAAALAGGVLIVTGTVLVARG